MEKIFRPERCYLGDKTFEMLRTVFCPCQINSEVVKGYVLRLGLLLTVIKTMLQIEFQLLVLS
jgi:hypothetical protein